MDLVDRVFQKYEFGQYTKRLYGTKLRAIHRYRMGRILALVLSHREAFSKQTILEIGCSDLFLLCLLCEADVAPLRYVGRDVFWENALLFAQQNGAALHESFGVSVEVINEPAESLSFAHTFDTVVLLETLEHVLEERAVLDRVCGVLRPRGHLLLAVPVEFGLVFALKEIVRFVLKGSTQYTFVEYINGILGRTANVKRVTGDHKGYDYRKTVRQLNSLGFTRVKELHYPCPSQWLSYGYVGLWRFDRVGGEVGFARDSSPA